MKMLKFKLIIALIVLGVLSSGLILAEEKTKEYNESWSATSVDALVITNKFGEVKVLNEGGPDVTIDVVVTVEARDEKRADDLLDKIEVDIRKSGTTIKAVTSIESNFKSQRKFSIDYVVNIPSDKKLSIENKYGDTEVNTLSANGNFNIQYGNFSAGELTGQNTKINLAYGKSNVSAAGNLDVIVKYSGMNFGEIKNLRLESKYSVVDIEEGNSIQIESKYDKFNFEEVDVVSATTKYSHLRIEELAKSLNIEAGYGSVKIGEISTDFESISITNSYGQISLGLDDASYSVDASCTYCGISYPEDDFSGDKIKENNTSSIKGKIRDGGGKVFVRSRYGEIKLGD